ncbi:hypothetical protein HYZ98_03975 [Candidatus Peregrinibacteria bacterium]|nr:hypothetical protein [Candidatus Peregrinibacteria bacterium]
MLVFAAQKDAGIQCTGGQQPLLVYPSGSSDPKGVTLLGIPEEQPRAKVFSWPGEYNSAGMTLRGIGHTEGRQVSFVAVINSVRCAFISSPLHEWTDHELELLGDIAVLVVPAEKPKILQKIIDEVDPRVLVLVPAGGKMDPEVLSVCGAKTVDPVSEYKLKGALPAEGREVVILKN